MIIICMYINIYIYIYIYTYTVYAVLKAFSSLCSGWSIGFCSLWIVTIPTLYWIVSERGVAASAHMIKIIQLIYVDTESVATYTP